jgi:hypothetical protein
MASINFYSGGVLLTGNSYSKIPAPVVLRTDMESGPAKQRPWASYTYEQNSVTYLFSNTEYTAFRNWFYNTAGMGSLAFNWVDPADGVTKDGRIVNGQINVGEPSSATMNYWTVQFIIETASNNGSL